jgi:hypothetical protein
MEKSLEGECEGGGTNESSTFILTLNPHPSSLSHSTFFNTHGEAHSIYRSEMDEAAQTSHLYRLTPSKIVEVSECPVTRSSLLQII